MLGCLTLAVVAQLAPSPDSTARDTIRYGCRLAEFAVRSDEVFLVDSAWVSYREMTVHADSIRYDIDRHRLTAMGDVLFTSGNQNITGVEMVYDLDSRRGMMRTARTEIGDGFFWAQEVWLVTEKALNARRGYYSTCEYDRPHYAFYGSRVKFLMDDVAVVQPVVFELRGVPLLAAPFWLVPVGSKRKSGLMPFKVGHSNDQGYYAKDVAYYLVVNDYADATFYCDVMTRKGVQPRFEGVYIVDPVARGSVQGSFITEWDTRRRRYSLNAAHRSRFFLGAELDAQADLQSDSRYVPEYGEDQIDWLKQEVYSYAELSRSVGRAGKVTALGETKTDFTRHYGYTHLPRLTFSPGTSALPLGWQASPRLTVENTLWTYQDSTGADTARTNDRNGSASVGLSSPDYSLGGLGRLNLSASSSADEERSYRDGVLDDHSRRVSTSLGAEMSHRPLGIFTTYEDLGMKHTDDLIDSVLPETRYSASASAEMSLHRVYGVEALGIHGLLHTARPGVGVSYEPRSPTRSIVSPPLLFSPELARLNFALQNGFQAKVGPLKTKQDLGQLSLGTSCELDTFHVSPLLVSAGLFPFRSLEEFDLRVDATMSFDFDSTDLTDDYSVGSALHWDHAFGSEPDSLGQSDSAATAPGRATPAPPRIQLDLAHSLGYRRNMLTAAATLQLPGWRFTLANLGYNFEQRELTDYDLTIWKGLHCWEAVVHIERLGETWKYDFELRITRLPDVKFGKSTFRTFLPE